MALPQENGELGLLGGPGCGEKQMQFIVIYGVRFIYGGQYRLSGDWGRVRLGGGCVCALTTKGSPRNRGTAPSWALAFLALGSCLDKAQCTWKCPPSPSASPRALSSGRAQPAPEDFTVRKWQQVTVKTSVGPQTLAGLHVLGERATASPAWRGKEASQPLPAIPVTVLSPGYYY